MNTCSDFFEDSSHRHVEHLEGPGVWIAGIELDELLDLLLELS